MISPDKVKMSPNYNKWPVNGKTVIIHATRSGTSMNPTELGGTLNWFSNPASQASSHWVVGRDGTKVRVVSDDYQAWHAQEDNDNSWGIELEQGVESDGFTAPQMESLLAISDGYVKDFGVPISHATDSIMGGFIGHQETVQGRRNGKSDPGSLFDWDYFIAKLVEMNYVPEPVLDGWIKDGNRWLFYNNGVNIEVRGDIAGEFPGRIAKLFGNTWYWLRKADTKTSNAYWSTEEGD